MANDKTLIGLLVGGESKEAGKTISARKKYNRYVTEKESNGEKPLSFEKWREQNENGS